MNFISNLIKNVHNLEDIGCPKVTELRQNFAVWCPNHPKIEPWSPNEPFWHCSKLKGKLFYLWLEEKLDNGSTGGSQSDLSHAISSIERLHVSGSKK